MTISGIRPDFIRMSSIFRLLDEKFNHILVHTGQHYDDLLSGVFFDDLNIRCPDFTLETGKRGGTHYHQLGYLSVAIVELIKTHHLRPDIILFLGDSNTVCASLPLRKEGYIIGHIEAGMRSFDKNMLEELNRTCCDHCSHLLFVYHEDYKEHLRRENIVDNVHVVGNTIVEVCRPFIPPAKESKRKDIVLLDIHRPENFRFPERMRGILRYANACIARFGKPVHMLRFHGTCRSIEEHGLNIGQVQMVDLKSFRNYIDAVYHCAFLISDSGTGQEEPALCGTRVVVPRDFTERPQSVAAKCSIMLDVNGAETSNQSAEASFAFLAAEEPMEVEWLGNGTTSYQVVDQISKFLGERA